MSEKLVNTQATSEEKPSNIVDYIPYIPSDEVILKAHGDGIYNSAKRLNADLIQAKEDGANDETENIKTELRDLEFIEKVVLGAQNAQQYESNMGMTVSDILAKRALVAQSRLEKWAESGRFPDNWENTVRERNLLGVAIDQLESIKKQKEQAGHYMVNPDK